MVDHWWHQPRGSLDRSLEATSVCVTLSRMHTNDEGMVAVLTVCLNGGLGGGERPVAEVDGGGDFLLVSGN
jgi:hypothetical protein